MSRSPAPADIAIHIDGLTVAYASARVPVLEDIELRLRTSRITAILGASGVGKSSLLGSCNRLLDRVAGCRVRGRVWFDAQDVWARDCDVRALRRRIGMIFQRPNPFAMSIRRNLALGLIEHGVRNRRELDHRIEVALRAVGLWGEVEDRLDRSALQLSGGQQQRLCFARALALDPEVLLLDEPCSALDPRASRVVEELIVSLRERCTVVLVTHDLGSAKRVADDLALLWAEPGQSARVIESGALRDVIAGPRDPRTASYLAAAVG